MKHAPLLFTVFALPALAEDAPATGFCIENASPQAHLFVTETREGARQSATLAPGETLCASETAAADGIINVFENADVLEGCGRIVERGATEALIAYAEFDRCEWRSHGS